MSRRFVATYSEVALKGNNRPEFVRSLRRNINKALQGVDHEVSHSEGRFIIDAAGEEGEVMSRLSHVFGIAWYAPISMVTAEYQAILKQVLTEASGVPGGTFKVASRRSDKGFALSSQELATRLGAEVVKATGKKVSLNSPEATIHVDVTRSGALVYASKVKGPGGLPLGTAGRAIHLFSGGIDSPVAAWLMMKRGTRPVYLHFYLAPTPQSAVDSKITRLVKTLSAYGGKSTLVLVPFAQYQLATSGVPGEMEPSLFRRFMRMTAEALAPRFDAIAISTGDSLSQAASQTLWNIGSFDEGSSLPVLRPLLTYDKEEIIALARRIGTYDASLEEYKDCCAIITRHPRTRVRSEAISELIRRHSLPELVGRVVDEATLVTYNPAGGVLRATPLAESMPVGVGPSAPALAS
jgi:thiamine biosynthesis protein ThiI